MTLTARVDRRAGVHGDELSVELEILDEGGQGGTMELHLPRRQAEALRDQLDRALNEDDRAR